MKTKKQAPAPPKSNTLNDALSSASFVIQPQSSPSMLITDLLSTYSNKTNSNSPPQRSNTENIANQTSTSSSTSNSTSLNSKLNTELATSHSLLSRLTSNYTIFFRFYRNLLFLFVNN
jgi:hypothetical protein